MCPLCLATLGSVVAGMAYRWPGGVDRERLPKKVQNKGNHFTIT
jgi:hypothetical protein